MRRRLTHSLLRLHHNPAALLDCSKYLSYDSSPPKLRYHDSNLKSNAPPLFLKSKTFNVRFVGASLFSDEGVPGDWLSLGDQASAMYGMLESTPRQFSILRLSRLCYTFQTSLWKFLTALPCIDSDGTKFQNIFVNRKTRKRQSWPTSPSISFFSFTHSIKSWLYNILKWDPHLFLPSSSPVPCSRQWMPGESSVVNPNWSASAVPTNEWTVYNVSLQIRTRLAWISSKSKFIFEACRSTGISSWRMKNLTWVFGRCLSLSLSLSLSV